MYIHTPDSGREIQQDNPLPTQLMGNSVVQNVGDNRSSTQESLATSAHQWMFNGSGFDRQRNNTQGTLLASATRTSTIFSPDQTNYNARGAHIILDVTNIGTGSVTLSIEEKDFASSKYVPLLTGSTVTTNGTISYKIYPGLTAVANSVANDVLPRTWRVTVSANNSNPVTYSVGYGLVL